MTCWGVHGFPEGGPRPRLQSVLQSPVRPYLVLAGVLASDGGCAQRGVSVSRSSGASLALCGLGGGVFTGRPNLVGPL